jgi:hypothetical protein
VGQKRIKRRGKGSMWRQMWKDALSTHLYMMVENQMRFRYRDKIIHRVGKRVKANVTVIKEETMYGMMRKM